MTWAIAMPGFPTGGVLLADVRVSFIDPTSMRVVDEIDGIQKVHRVAPNLAIAFAGSVEAGFLLANDLTNWLSGLEEGHAWSPARVATEWSGRLKYVWGRLPQDIRNGGCELLLVGAFPGSHPPFAYSDAFRFRAPDFDMELLPRGKASSIGSGSDVAVYVEMIESFGEDLSQLSEFSLLPFPGGPAGPMSVVLGELIRDHPGAGVSSQFVLCLVGTAETSIHTVESPRPELATPPLATTLEEFHALCAERGVSAAIAVARLKLSLAPEKSPRAGFPGEIACRSDCKRGRLVPLRSQKFVLPGSL